MPGTAQQAMYAVGVVEVVAGLLVALAPRFGALLVAAWLAGIIVNLLRPATTTTSRCGTSACCSAAVALARLAAAYGPARRPHGA